MRDPRLVDPGDRQRGILDFGEALRHFTLRRYAPPPALEPWLESFWQLAWDLPPGTRHAQSNISHGSFTLAFEEDGAWLYGVPERVFSRELEGRGLVFGAKFHPGAFFPFWPRDLSRLRGRRLPLEELWPEAGPELHREVLGAKGEEERLALVGGLILGRLPPREGRAPALVARLLALPPVTRVGEAATRLGLGERALESLFRMEVGIGPKELLRRIRLQLAAERLAREPGLSCAALALELGYADQPHFIKDFRSVVGRPPSAYRRAQ